MFFIICFFEFLFVEWFDEEGNGMLFYVKKFEINFSCNINEWILIVFYIVRGEKLSFFYVIIVNCISSYGWNVVWFEWGRKKIEKNKC